MAKKIPPLNDLTTKPRYLTTMGPRFDGGRVRSTGDGSMWLYRGVPLSSVSDAKDTETMLRSMEPLYQAIEEMARLANATSGRRFVAKSSYRQLHLLAVNLPTWFHLGPEHALANYLNRSLADEVTMRRFVMFGVKLRDRVGGGGGLKDQIDSLAQFMADSQVPLGDYDEDYETVDAGLSRAGLYQLSPEEFSLADSWWNGGVSPGSPILPHLEHLHVFHDPNAVSDAEILRKEATDNNGNFCEMLGEIPSKRQSAITVASVAEFEFNFTSPDDPGSHWVSSLLNSDALAVSIRALAEPASVTNKELKRQRDRFVQDVEERRRAGKLDDQAQSAMLQSLVDVEGFYSQKGTNATLVDMSTLVAFPRIVDFTRISADNMPYRLAPMSAKQRGALAEMWLCSNIRANPNLFDVPNQVVSASGITGLSLVGDATGAMPGLTEIDRQPAFLDPRAASHEDRLPLLACFGATGSGKALRLSTPIPVPVSSKHPTGFTTMGEIQVGDTVFGRDGKPCRVTWTSAVDKEPDLYRMRLSDGQTLYADGNHQHVVSTSTQRSAPRRPKHLVALQNQKRVNEFAAAAMTLATRTPSDLFMTTDELLDLIAPINHGLFPSPTSIYGALRMADVPSRRERRETVRANKTRVVERTAVVEHFDARAALVSWLDFWDGATPANRARWEPLMRARFAAVRLLLDTVPFESYQSVPDLIRQLQVVDPTVGKLRASDLRTIARRANVKSRYLSTTTQAHKEASSLRASYRTTHPVQSALKAMADRVKQRASELIRIGDGEVVLSTNEILGLKDLRRLAIRTTAPLDLPEALLPIAPYVLGAWLGDGVSGTGEIISADRPVVESIIAAGYPLRYERETGTTRRYAFEGLAEDLFGQFCLEPSASYRKLDKRIPARYLRASAAQRLALLQGLMDTDGTVSKSGNCEISLSKPDLAGDVLQLVRSLGIKATMIEREAGYRGKDGQRVRCKNRFAVRFTTDVAVFRLERKKDRLPRHVRQTQQWLYITSIERVLPGDADYEAARCIGVDSVDYTYLVEGFIPTHNSMSMLVFANHFCRLGENGVIVDPKQKSDFAPFVLASGGQVNTLDDLLTADGVLDPIRIAPNPRDGVSLALSLLTQINPWGGARDDMEQPLGYALQFGAERGATCIGEALKIAQAAVGKELPADTFPDGMIRKVLQTAEMNPHFRAVCGMEKSTTQLSLSDGVTLIMVGNSNLDVPTGPPENMSQRIGLAVIRMMVFGSAYALTARGGGFIMLDEAWMFLSAGRAEIDRLGRLARSQRILPMLFTQRATDAVEARLQGYISRIMVGRIEDREEAMAACELAGLEPARFVPRIIKPARKGGDSNRRGPYDEESMSAIKWDNNEVERGLQPRGSVKRGSIWYYSDLRQRTVPIEVMMDPELYLLGSTSPEDVKWREDHPDEVAEIIARLRDDALNARLIAKARKERPTH